MGACCTCQRVRHYDQGNHRHHNIVHNINGDDKSNIHGEDDHGVIGKGDFGANIRLHGYSKFVSMYSQQGKKGINQDAMTVWENFGGDKGAFFCGVFDGHGPSGHKVARYVRDLLPSKISSSLKECNEIRNSENDEESHQNSMFDAWKAAYLKSYKEMDAQLEREPSIESYSSGTTAVTLFKQGEHLFVGNLGDSRAIICTRDEKNQLISQQLTVDLKPHLPSEYERIKSCQGRVMAMEQEPNVYRVWMPDEDCPGLAMARAFGDFCLKDYGLISVPEVYYRKLTESDEFVVLATDGVWDVLSNDEVIRIVATTRKRSMAARTLVECAVRAWKYKYPRAKIDDCGVVCLFFKRQKPLLTKSMSEVTQLSFNYAELANDQNYPDNTKTDDGLDTLLNYQVKEGEDQEIAPGVQDGSDNNNKKKNSSTENLHHRGQRRRSAMKFVYPEDQQIL
ncbi:probable protein phosphatase 2C 65 [Lycium barbarum]|uniref:probable protein phosphatase 2C 65 n=1 Tax=Lycium barbarum TaxID=112863 RepID=UPI00293E2AD6|nr:probable protein phosphatase 2C 65 [Lycium barbarum]